MRSSTPRRCRFEHLKAQLAVLRRARFGRSSEKLDREIDQLELVLGELEESVAESNARTEQAKQERASPAHAKASSAQPADRKPGCRKPLPAHLPRERVLHEPAAACACCGGKVLRRIGDDVTEVLEYVPSSFTVMQHVRPKLSCRACETIVQAPLPSFPIERGRPGLGRTKTGRLWAVVRDERTWAGAAPPAAFYCYSPDRRGERAEALLGQCRGFLHADGYGGFNSLYVREPKTGRPRLTEVACWAH